MLDEDIIQFLDFKSSGAATLMGTWLQWLVEHFLDMIQTRKGQVPSKCFIEPFIYWVAVPQHIDFLRDKTNL